jgi:hypothetical protein
LLVANIIPHTLAYTSFTSRESSSEANDDGEKEAKAKEGAKHRYFADDSNLQSEVMGRKGATIQGSTSH